jgi:hypothetical protein
MEVNMSSLNNKEIVMKKNYLKALSFIALSLILVEAHAEPKTVEMREKEAFDTFMDLLICPLDQVPTWKEFVDKMVHLMEGNPKYAALRASLLKVRDTKAGIMNLGKKAIANELKQHESILPREIVIKVKTLGNDLAPRIRN